MSFFSENKFDAAKIEPNNGYDPLPEGQYPCLVIKCEEKSAQKDPENKYLNVELRVVGDKYKNRTLFHHINLKNKNEKAQQIGQGQLSAFCRATGVMQPKGAHEFANKTIRVSVKVVKSTRPGGGLENSVVKVEPMGGAQPITPATEPATSVSNAPWDAVA